MKKVESAHSLTVEEENVRVTRFNMMAQIIHIFIQFYFDLSIEAKQDCLTILPLDFCYKKCHTWHAIRVHWIWGLVTCNTMPYHTCVRVLCDTKMNSTVLCHKNKHDLCQHLMQPSLCTPRWLVRSVQIKANREGLRACTGDDA